MDKDIELTLKYIELINKYEEFDRKLDKLFLLDMWKYVKLNLQDMNKWLIEVINLYAEYGYQVNYSDFYNIFKSNTSNYKERNNIVNEYMKVFFSNKDNPDSDEFNNLVFGKFRDLEIIDMSNPFSDEIRDAVIDLSSNKKISYNGLDITLVDLLLREINGISKELGISNVNRENLIDIKNIVWNRIRELNSRLKDIEREVQEKIIKKEQLELKIKEQEKRKERKEKLCEVITYRANKKYSEMTDLEKQGMLEYLPLIVDAIIKLRIFMNFSSKYNKFAEENNYLSLKGQISSNLVHCSLMEEELNREIGKKKRLESKNKGIGNKTKIGKVDSKIISLISMINNLRIDNSKMKVGYLNKFYLENQLYDIFDKFDIYLDQESDKLFGIFDFDSLPLNNDIVNNMECFFKFGIRLSKLDSEEFILLSNLCLGLRDEILTNDIDSFSRK